MPRYRYACDTLDCGGSKDIVCTIKEKPELVQCPKCGCKMDQDFSGQGQSFKGDGWTQKFHPS